MGETYYDVLNVSQDAAGDEIQRAYRERVLETHPDRNDAPDAAETFKRVCDAEAVLGDPAERARYDRLGHDAYCRREAVGPSSTTSTDSSAAGDDGAATDRASDDDHHGPDSDGKTAYHPTDSTTWSDGTAGVDDDGPSHHARQRARRHRRTASGEWFFGHDDDTSARHERVSFGHRTRTTPSTSTAAEATRSTTARGTHSSTLDETRTTTGWTETTTTGDGSHSRETRAGDFAVHNWTGDVELTPPYRELDHQTLIAIGGLSLTYPLFVIASLTPALPLVVNAIVGGCTLVLVGYLLTFPRVALATFGLWSLLVPAGLSVSGAVPPGSLLWLALLAAFWTPFGYAVAVWWALSP